MDIITNLLNKTSAYGLLGILGFFAGLVYLFFISQEATKPVPNDTVSFEDYVFIYVWSTIGAIIGAKILYLMLDIKEIVITIHNSGFNYSSMYPYFAGGFVFYGGLFGSILGCVLVCKYFRFDFHKMISVLIPILPLMHAFGRIGCLIVGCCYGCITRSHFYIEYSHSQYAPNGVHLVPTQLIEAVFEFVMFFILTILLKMSVLRSKLIYIYLAAYSIFRFIIEFWRGDDIRGHIGPLSTSQLISILVLKYVIFVLFFTFFKQKNKIHIAYATDTNAYSDRCH